MTGAPAHRTKNITEEQVCVYCETGGESLGPVRWVVCKDSRGNVLKDSAGNVVRVRTGPGRVVVSYRVQGKGRVAEYGPCPHCEAGFLDEQRHWPQGFWQGRPTSGVVKPKRVVTVTHPPAGSDPNWVDIVAGTETVLSKFENTLRMHLLNLRLAGLDVDPAIGIDMLEGAARKRLVEREVARAKVQAFVR